MGVAAGSLADGTCPTTKTTVYTVPASTKAYVRLLTLHNLGTTTTTVVVYVKRSGSSSRVVDRGELGPSETGVSFDGVALTLSAGDEVELEASAGNVDYTLTGATET